MAFLPADIGAINEDETFSDLMIDKYGTVYLTTTRIEHPSVIIESRMYKDHGSMVFY